METRRGFKANHAGLARFLMSSQVHDPAREAGQDIRDAMKRAALAQYGITPDSARDGEHYADHFKINLNPTVVSIMPGGPRRSVDVYNDVGYGAVLEYGTKRRRGTRLMARIAAPWHSNKAGG